MTAECEAFRAVAPELALGIAVGDERAVALDHLATCPACRRELDALTATVDAIVQSAPAAEPPAGFELRALAGFDGAGDPSDEVDDRWSADGSTGTAGTDPAHRAPRPRRRWLVAASIVVVVGAVVAGAVSWRSSHGGARVEVAAGAQGVLRLPDGEPVGRVQLDRGQTTSGTPGSELVISVDAGAPVGRYHVRCDYEAGGPYAAGQLEVGPDGVARWSADVTVPTYDLRRVRLVSTTGGPNLEAEMS